MRKIKIVAFATVLLGMFVLGALWWHGQPGDNTPPLATDSSHLAFDKTRFSVNDSTSLWVVVNKARPLQPKNYEPEVVTPNVPLRLDGGAEEMHLRADAAKALETLVSEAGQQGLELMLASGYRSHQAQADLYSRYVKEQGQATADTQSARAGHSEHQTGLAADLEPTSRQCEVEVCFADLAEGKWLAKNAHKYGFIIRYPEGGETITGYTYEPWHLRYVGTDLSQEMHNQGATTLEQFFNLAPAPSY